MIANKEMSELSQDELTESFVLPGKLTPKQKKEAAIQLREARKTTQTEMTESDRIVSRLLQLRFQLEEYLAGSDFVPGLTFSYFLKEYVSILNKKRKVFADEIGIDETLLSQFVNMHRMPPDYVMIRLELHSNNIIPAEYWYRLVEKEKEHYIKTDKALRKREMKFVHGAVVVAG